MAKIDPEKERQRLAQFYAGQLDGELEKVAGEAYELSDLAREVLQAEGEKRGLSLQLAEHAPIPVKTAPKPGDPPEEDSSAAEDEDEEIPEPSGEIRVDPTEDARDMVTIRRFRDLPEALLAKGSLESAGIECALTDENMVRLDWLISNLLGGVKLQVTPDDAAAAQAILDQPIPGDFDVSGVGSYEQPQCPKCGSLDINFRETHPAAYAGLLVSLPLPLHRRAWRCQSCNTEWEDDGLPAADESST